MSQAIGLFVKPVRPGHVKTRMTPALSPEQAARLYAALLADTVSLLQSGADRWEWVVFATDPDEVRDTWPSQAPASAEFQPQVGIDLGERMHHALTTLIDLGFDRAMLLGSDHPTVPPAFLDFGFAALENVDTVLGPTTDGGYYTIGMTRPHADLFSGITFSQPDVFSKTVSRVRSLGLSFHCLPPWYDVDTVEDLNLLRFHLDALTLEFGSSEAPAPETRKFLDAVATP